jgi:serine phosphatase RsbU (regulator of sigma subunit)
MMAATLSLAQAPRSLMEPPASASHSAPVEAEERPASPPVSILIVDDQPSHLLALEASLYGCDYNLVRARSGVEALRWLLLADFALILMDVQMPGMDGFETAAFIRQRARCARTPIIFLTASQMDEAQVFRGYSVGAVDYLCKPIQPHVLRAKVNAFVDIFRKTEQVRQQGELLRRIEQREHERQLAEAKERWEAERLREEIRIARQIQQRFFPAAPLPLAGFDISGASYPAEATGGDYFDYVPMLGQTLGVVIGDVAGHGFGPALLMAETRAYLRAFLLTQNDVAAIVRLINRALSGDTEDRFATLFLGQLDPLTRSLVYASAGHVTGYLLDRSGGIKASLPSTGIPLAILPDYEYIAAPPLILEPEDMVVLLTDGIVEAHSPAEDLFGLDRTLNVIREHRDRPAREIVDALYQGVRDFCGARAQLDDMTAIIIKVGPSP